MKRIIAIIKPAKCEDVMDALREIGIASLTVYGVKGFGQRIGHTERDYGAAYTIDLLPKIQIMTVVPDDIVHSAVETIANAARSGKSGDGKIFVSNIVAAIRIRTGEPWTTPVMGSVPRKDETPVRMKQIVAIINPAKCEDVMDALREIGIFGLTVSEVMGYGRQIGHEEIYRGAEYTVDCRPKIHIMTVVPDAIVHNAVETIANAARSGKSGDGKIFVSNIVAATRIQTGEPWIAPVAGSVPREDETPAKMKRIVAIIKPFKLEEVKDALSEIGIFGLTVFEAKGCGRGLVQTNLRHVDYPIDFLPNIQIMTVLGACSLDVAVDAMVRGAQTEKVGDGKIFVDDIQATTRIRTGERGEEAL